MRPAARLGFSISSQEIQNDILVPRYYDPLIPGRLEELKASHDLVRDCPCFS